ncbi:MAG: GNAT family N-acetyltransferase [Moritella sp.]|uniref:GNAT family N-acetyltransferase n=1 Tax=Moritella sp. TaxID=78556 RepID=UPI0029B0D125|nr:GNAT family N-acetyltransferase [Moritella sp.]MDX2320553.1 GNAT family N-acetyltransferase [Moritella sp.]
MQFQWLNKIENPLVKPFYKQYLPYSRPNKAEHIAVLKDNKTIIACARLRPIGKLSLLTGMLVSPDYRGRQLGHAILQHMQPQFKHQQTFTFALPHLENFYRQHGFTQTEQVPNDIQQRFLAYQKQGKSLLLLGFNNSNQAGI